MSAASVAVVVTSGERHEGKAGMVLFAVKTAVCDPCLSALCVYTLVQKGAINTFPFLFLLNQIVPAHACTMDHIIIIILLLLH